MDLVVDSYYCDSYNGAGINRCCGWICPFGFDLVSLIFSSPFYLFVAIVVRDVAVMFISGLLYVTDLSGDGNDGSVR